MAERGRKRVVMVRGKDNMREIKVCVWGELRLVEKRTEMVKEESDNKKC